MRKTTNVKRTKTYYRDQYPYLKLTEMIYIKLCSEIIFKNRHTRDSAVEKINTKIRYKLIKNPGYSKQLEIKALMYSVSYLLPFHQQASCFKDHQITF